MNVDAKLEIKQPCYTIQSIEKKSSDYLTIPYSCLDRPNCSIYLSYFFGHILITTCWFKFFFFVRLPLIVTLFWAIRCKPAPFGHSNFFKRVIVYTVLKLQQKNLFLFYTLSNLLKSLQRRAINLLEKWFVFSRPFQIDTPLLFNKDFKCC